MKICLVTAFPPSREALNEYGFHIARELQVIPELDVTIMADDYPGDEPELECGRRRGAFVVRGAAVPDASALQVREEEPPIQLPPQVQ